MDELVSIIMPSYNTANYIAASIQSVLDQTYPNWELLLVDDCSTDDTDAVVAPFLSDARIRYLKNEQNSGAAISRNRALREAKGRWIAFLDSDDLWYPTKLEAQLRFMPGARIPLFLHELRRDQRSRRANRRARVRPEADHENRHVRFLLAGLSDSYV